MSFKIFDKFKSLSFGLGLENNLVQKEKREISKKVDTYIDGKMLEVVFSHIHSGYKMSASQEKALETTFSTLSKNEQIATLNRVIWKNVTIKDNFLVKFFANFSEHVFEKLRSDSVDLISELYGKKLADTDFTDKVYKKWVSDLNKFKPKVENYHYQDKNRNYIRNEIISPMHYFYKNLLQGQDLEDYSNIIQKLTETTKYYMGVKKNYGSSVEFNWFAEVLNRVQTYYKNNYDKQIEQDEKKINVLYAENNLAQLAADKHLKIDTNALPKKMSNVLEEIKCNYLFLNKNIEQLDQEEKFTVENLWTKRVPEILNKYFHADPEFRISMRNNAGKNIEDVTLDSLTNINESFNSIKENHTKSLLLSADSLNRYTKAIR
jgi:hypothetical protein